MKVWRSGDILTASDLDTAVQVATSGQPGLVQPDGVTITVNPNGVISSVGGTAKPGGLAGQIQFNNSGSLGGYFLGPGLVAINGTLSVAFGSAFGTAVAGNDPRLVGSLQTGAIPAATGALLGGSGIAGQATGVSVGAGLALAGGVLSATGTVSGTTTAGVSSFNGQTGVVTLGSADVTGALGFTPYNATNPNNYVTGSDLAAAAYTLPAATNSTLGGVRPDGNTIIVNNGIISAIGAVAPSGGTSGAVQFDAGTGMLSYTLPIAAAGVLGGVKPGAGVSIAVDGTLSATGSAGVSTFNTRTGAITLTLGDVTGALAFTPYDAANPSGYQTAAQVAAALGPAGTTGQLQYNNAGAFGGLTVGTSLAVAAGAINVAVSATNPAMDGTAAVGTAATMARSDHVHPTDTSRAPLASPTFTGSPVVPGYLTTATAASTYAPLASPTFTGTVTIPAGASISGFAPMASPTFTGVPAAPTAAVDTSTTQVASTAFVVAQAASATPLAAGTAAAGTSTRFARGDHVHPTDTTRAPLASPTFTGTVTIPSGASIAGFAPLDSPTFTTRVVVPSWATRPTSPVAGTLGWNTANIRPDIYDGTSWQRLLEYSTDAYGSNPAMNGTASAGANNFYARGDHVHPSDTSRLATASNLSDLASAATARTNLGLPANFADYVVGGGNSGTLANSQRVLIHPLPHAITLPASLTGSSGVALTAATASTAFTLAYVRSGTPTTIATFTFAAAGTTATISGVSIPTLQAGDILTMTGPATADATLADVGFSILGTRQ